MKERLKGLNGLSIALIVASMVLFPHGLLTGSVATETIGAICLGVGCLVGLLHDYRKRQPAARP